MAITEVEPIVLRRHEPARAISYGTQHALAVRIATDGGLAGPGFRITLKRRRSRTLLGGPTRLHMTA
jgi:hypothetical protein